MNCCTSTLALLLNGLVLRAVGEVALYLTLVISCSGGL
jgi:hypothetical protein